MRIIAGSARGRPLTVPKSVTRPTADRTREALFSILAGEIPGARVLDLYAGSGSLGLEALSRGAGEAWFVEQNRAAVVAIGANAEKARLSDRVTVRQQEVEKFLKTPTGGGKFDVIFADPPYKKQESDTDHAAFLLGSAGLLERIAEDGIFVLEEWSSRVLDSAALTGDTGWEMMETRTYGSANLHFFRPPAHA